MNIDIDVDDVLWSMSSYEKKEMLNALLDDMDIEVITECLKDSKVIGRVPNITSKIDEEEFNYKVLG